MKPNKVLIINGSIRGEAGNSGAIATRAMSYLSKLDTVTASQLTLTDALPSFKRVQDLLEEHDGFLIISGVYWNNWGSPLQKFIEVVSVFENTTAFFGKPVACAVSMDSVGGIEVAARIHAAFAGLGCWSPPCSTVVLSRVGQEAIAASVDVEHNPNEDVWRLDDLAIVLGNLVASLQLKADWKSWPHTMLTVSNGEWPSKGELDLGSPKFL